MTKLPSASVVIATRNRPQALLECLESLRGQVYPPVEVIVVDSSDEAVTRAVCERSAGELSFPLCYIASSVCSAAGQRNTGAEHATGEVLIFLDDDVILEPRFSAELLAPFRMDDTNELGGVCGTITNEIPAPMSSANRHLLRWVLGKDPMGCAGRVIGPAVQFPFLDGNGEVRRVDWLPSGVCAYRRKLFYQYRFGQTFEGYSFMEDVELSVRIGRRYRLMQATGARLRHKGLGNSSQTDWVAHGKSRILNRHYVMANAMGKRDKRSLARLFCYEILYSTMAGFWNSGRGGAVKRTTRQLIGRLQGAFDILRGRSPHAEAQPGRATARALIR